MDREVISPVVLKGLRLETCKTCMISPNILRGTYLCLHALEHIYIYIYIHITHMTVLQHDPQTNKNRGSNCTFRWPGRCCGRMRPPKTSPRGSGPSGGPCRPCSPSSRPADKIGLVFGCRFHLYRGKGNPPFWDKCCLDTKPNRWLPGFLAAEDQTSHFFCHVAKCQWHCSLQQMFGCANGRWIQPHPVPGLVRVCSFGKFMPPLTLKRGAWLK